MKLILFLAAIYALIFYQSYKIKNTNQPKAMEAKAKMDYQIPAINQGNLSTNLSFGQTSDNKNSRPMQPAMMVSLISDNRQFAIK